MTKPVLPEGSDERIAHIHNLIRNIPDFPKPGILFHDITTVLRDADAWEITVDRMCQAVADLEYDYIAGMESRGFILGSAMAYKQHKGFVPIRKPGKLPAAVHAVSYELEYGVDALEIHQDALTSGDRVLIADDLLATGGTAAAAANLIHACGAQIAAMVFLVELQALGGRAVVEPVVPEARVETLLAY
ncbi:MAG: adenine phosphoribosyltransferase [Candidatus Nanopelagicales bacterium]